MAGGLVKTYRFGATLALLHLLALGGGVGYLISTGRLDAVRAREIVSLLSGPDAGDAADSETVEAEDQGDDAAGKPVWSAEEERLREESAWRNAERYRAEIEQRLKFIIAARVDVDRRREEFEKLKSEQRLEEKRRAAQQDQVGYAKEIELIAALKPKVALQQLMNMSDADAARIVFELETRKAKKIFEAARNEAEAGKLTKIRRLIRDMKSDGGPAESASR